jgi:hypothetical protein
MMRKPRQQPLRRVDRCVQTVRAIHYEPSCACAIAWRRRCSTIAPSGRHNGAKHISLLLAQFRALVDLGQVAQSSRNQLGNDTNAYLLDIFGRVVIPNLDIVPKAGAFADEGLAQYRIPGTPIRITRIDAGPRDGEFLFNARTVHVAPRFYRAVGDLPLRSRLGITSWNTAMP